MEQISDTTKNILSAIQDKHVTPRSRWYFVLRNSILWVPGVVTTLLGAYTVAGVVYGIMHVEIVQGRVQSTGGNPLFYIATMPLLWVASFGLFSLVSIILLRKTHNGYRHTTLQLLSISVASSIVIGILFYAVTQDSDDNTVNTYYRYPTQHQKEYYERIFPAERMIRQEQPDRQSQPVAPIAL
ncbi:MAG: protein of unknown function with transrane region [Candidatus Nomurabacteria bacterium]|nr:protein of unknown function with transrane region [Candidatus Nomurabacteria bacterium]